MKIIFQFLIISALFCSCSTEKYTNVNQDIIDELNFALTTELLDAWYPLTIDSVYGGFLSDFTFDWQQKGQQNKMIVTQARHLWTLSEAAMFLDNDTYRQIADHAYVFLRDVMWDKNNGGFYSTLSRDGIPGKTEFGGVKMAYGSAFGIYALVAYYNLSRNKEALELAKKTFLWLENYSHDPIHGGYFNKLQANGSLLSIGNNDQLEVVPQELPNYAEISQKDQNTSIHMLEALTELYKVWPDELVKTRLQEMYDLISEKIVCEKGYLSLFLTRDWQAISFRDSSETVIKRNLNIDHVSFGHDIETGFLLLEAAHALGKMDEKAITLAKKMFDHTIENGWDKTNSGIYDRGYYFNDSDTCTIMHDTKVWWSEAESMNALLLMSKLFPDEKHYHDHFIKQWEYIKEYLIDHENKGWYSEGLDNSPHSKTSPKASDWKVNYHNFRTLKNCIQMLKGEHELASGQ